MDKLLRRFVQVVVAMLLIIAAAGLYYLFANFRVHENPWIIVLNRLLVTVFGVYIAFIANRIFFERNRPSKTISWLLVLYIQPIIGFILYILIGQNVRKKWRARKKALNHRHKIQNTVDIQREIMDYIELFTNEESFVNDRLINLLLKSSNAPFFVNNKIEILNNGEETYNMMIEKIEDAWHHIHMQSFIIRDDVIGNKIKDLLIKKASEGVEVRLIYDSVGCWRLSKKYIQDLKNGGVEVYSFFPVVLPIIRRELNYRNHRKILIVDGTAGFVGGLNIGDEYLGHDPNIGFWRDTHLMIEGEATYSLQSIFLMDWDYVSSQALKGLSYYPKIGRMGEQIMQIASSGPDSDWLSIYHSYFTMIATAEKRIWITTPYLVPEESIMMGLKTAALSGIDVRIIIPSKADHMMVYWASRANVEELLEAGVRIYSYQKGFIHSKILLVDGIGGSVGTANLDIRSLEINFEISAFVYDKTVVNKLEIDFKQDLMDSEEIILDDYQKRSTVTKFKESLGRLVSPLQ